MESQDCRDGLYVQCARELRLCCVRGAGALRSAQTKTSYPIKMFKRLLTRRENTAQYFNCYTCLISFSVVFFFLLVLRHNAGHGLLIHEVSRAQWRTTDGRIPLDKGSGSRRDLYLTAHNNHNRQTFMSPAGFEPTISAGERTQTYALDRSAIGTGWSVFIVNNYYYNKIKWRGIRISRKLRPRKSRLFRTAVAIRSVVCLGISLLPA